MAANDSDYTFIQTGMEHDACNIEKTAWEPEGKTSIAQQIGGARPRAVRFQSLDGNENYQRLQVGTIQLCFTDRHLVRLEISDGTSKGDVRKMKVELLK